MNAVHGIPGLSRMKLLPAASTIPQNQLSFVSAVVSLKMESQNVVFGASASGAMVTSYAKRSKPPIYFPVSVRLGLTDNERNGDTPGAPAESAKNWIVKASA